MAATPTGRVDPNSDPHGLSRWDEGTQVVLVRTDPNHAEMLNEHFHVMEVEREGREVPNGGRIYRLRKWDDHTRVILAHSTALMKATDFVLSNFVKLDASEREEVAHNIFQTCPSLLVERQSPANGPVLVTTPRGPRTYASPTRAAKHAGPPPAPGLGAASYSGAAPAENSDRKPHQSHFRACKFRGGVPLQEEARVHGRPCAQTVLKCGPMSRTWKL